MMDGLFEDDPIERSREDMEQALFIDDEPCTGPDTVSSCLDEKGALSDADPALDFEDDLLGDL